MDRTTYDSRSNVPYEREINVRFFPDAGNAPTFVAADNLYVNTITRTAQGAYLITLLDTFVRFAGAQITPQIAAAGGAARFWKLGAVSNVGTSTPVTVQLFCLDNADAAQNPVAANAANSVSVKLTFIDIAAV